MKTIHFSVEINASREKVWKVLWDDKSYRQWTTVFSPGSYAESDWEEGGKILFLAGGSGMSSLIKKKVINEFMSFKHMAMIKDNEEQPPTDESRKWAGAYENYTLKETGGKTTLTVDIDLPEEDSESFNEMFPKALELVKKLSETE